MKVTDFNLSLDDLSDLPPELRKELAFRNKRKNSLETQILVVVDGFGGTADLNQILVGLYRKFGLIKSRISTQNKVSRMCGAGILTSLEKGIYTTKQQSRHSNEEG
jgi:hypothetical protein